MSAGCIESKKDAVQDHVSRQQRRPLSLSRGLRQYFEVRLPIWPSVANAHPPRVVQRTQSVPRRGTRPVLERMSAYACRHPHTRAVSRVGARLVRYSKLPLASERGWPHLGSGVFRLFGGVVSRHILWLEAGQQTRTKRGDHLPRACDAGGARGRRRSTSRSIPA